MDKPPAVSDLMKRGEIWLVGLEIPRRGRNALLKASQTRSSMRRKTGDS